MWRRFVAGRPVSTVTIELLAWCSAQLAAQGVTAWCLIWDNASWHADRLLSANELEARVYAYYSSEREAHLVMPKKVA
jgi:hypothetical protein